MNEEKNMVYCPSCGEGNPDSSRFCSNCGASLMGAKVEQAASASDAPQQEEKSNAFERADAEIVREGKVPLTGDEINIHYGAEEGAYSAGKFSASGNADASGTSYYAEGGGSDASYYADGNGSGTSYYADGNGSGTSYYADGNASGASFYSDGTSGAAPVKGGNGNIGVAIASMVCGILSLVCCCLSWMSLVLAIAAIVLGIIAVNGKYDGRGMAIAGIITGGIGIFIWLILILITGSSLFGAFLDELSYYY